MATTIKKPAFETITFELLHSLMPAAPENLLYQYRDELNKLLPAYGITNPNRIAAFLAQGAADTNELQEVTETLNYHSKDVLALWPNTFLMVSDIKLYAYNPQKIAEKLYANKFGNGNSASGDAYKYRGRGWFKTIGKDAYHNLTQILTVDFLTYPDLLAAPRYALLSACITWKDLGLSELADTNRVKAIFNKLGGIATKTNSRIMYYNKALAALKAPRAYAYAGSKPNHS